MQLKAGIHGAEPWTEEMRKKIEDILHINCFDIYGLCEITGPGVALDCIHHEGLHVYEDHFYPEILNPSTQEPCADGETGELVFTTLPKKECLCFGTARKILQVLITVPANAAEHCRGSASLQDVLMI